MTVIELIDRLKKLDNQSAEAIVNVRVCTQAFGVAQCKVWDVDQSYDGATLEITLPDNMHVVVRKQRS